MNINEEVEAINQEIANGPPLFPPPNTIPRSITTRFKRRTSRGKRRITGYGLFKLFIICRTSEHSTIAINRVAGELWKATNRDNREGYIDLCNQIN
ncbi:hypothetical protein RclHR1_01790024 [Rhizophagus clarus]|uniref:HMG box domain-containing protein n=1 Tax=Rhizophagus clarus TaxID=94130 RepID=A0A2Z6QKZ2_9GLOM|nr:hypothetical protein RclHR1_01790024 [Rhizophagus clarus]GES98857.1 hypothetical protein GLOIN_2v1768491 [Rhizophagus clarus]